MKTSRYISGLAILSALSLLQAWPLYGAPLGSGRMSATHTGVNMGRHTARTRVHPGQRPSQANASPRVHSGQRPSQANARQRVHHAQPGHSTARTQVNSFKTGRINHGHYNPIYKGIKNTRHGAYTGKNYSQLERSLKRMPQYNSIYRNNNFYRIKNHALWPGGWHPGASWSKMWYYTGYWWGGYRYPYRYYALNSYCPTLYLLDLLNTTLQQIGTGKISYLPAGYQLPITVAVQEQIPIADAYGNILRYQNETFYYNALWNASAQAYGYFDYHNQYHLLTYQWYNTWLGTY